jgi:hypothetical protein
MKDKAKKIKPVPDNRVIKAFLFCFSILQNSRTIENFIEYLRYTFYFFCSEFCHDLFFRAYHQIKNQIADRNIVIFVYSSVNSNNKTLNQAEEEINFTKTIKNSSPFTVYFNDLRKKFEKEMNQQSKSSSGNSLKANFFYCPELFDKIDNLLHLLPFWSGILIEKLDLPSKLALRNPDDFNLTRFTNNPVESYFKIIKNHYFRNESQMPSQIASSLYKRVISTYFMYYKSAKVSFSKSIHETNADLSKETWESHSSKKTKKGVTKGYYYKDVSDFPQIENGKKELYEKELFEIYNNSEYLIDVFDKNNNGIIKPGLQNDDKKCEATSFYHLKLNGANNSCYSNATLQSLLHLGEKFNSQVN